MLNWLTAPFRSLRLSKDTTKKIVLPNTGNIWTGVVIFGGLSLFVLVSGIASGKFFISSFFWQMSLLALVPLVWMTSFIKAQTVVLSEATIRHSKLGFFRLVVKEFKFEDIDYWKFDQLTLVVVLKGGKAPSLPHGPFADLSKVLLIPRSLYMPRTKEITDYLLKKGVRKKGK